MEKLLLKDKLQVNNTLNPTKPIYGAHIYSVNYLTAHYDSILINLTISNR